MVTAGEVLKKKRESLGRSIDIASQDTKIQRRFLEYIESNEFSKFDSEIFLTGFLKIYSKYLDLDTEKILALYRRSKPQRRVKPEKKTTAFHFKNEMLTPKNIVTALSIIFLIIILGYIGLQIYRFQSPPKLEIEQPLDNTTTDQANITVKGTTNSGVTLEINDSLTDVDSSGRFQKDVTLKEGINTITIKATKNNNNILETVETRKVTYTKPVQTEETTPTVKTFTLTVEVKNSASWVKLDIDNQNKLAQVVQPSKSTYDVKQSFYIITGKVNNTNIYMNGEPLAWKTNSTTGVAEITCTITDQTLNCN